MSANTIAPQVPSVPWVRTRSRELAIGVLVGAVAATLTMYGVNHPSLKGVATVFVVLAAAWMLTTRHTHLALAVLMLYLGLLDGFLKLATGSTAVSGVRDLLLFAIVLGLLVRAVVQRKQFTWPPLTGWVLAFVVLVLIQIPNPNGGTLVHSLAGVRQDLEFVPLFFLAYLYVRTKKALRVFLILLAVIAAGNGIASLVQFNETPQQFAAWGPGYSQRVLGTGNLTGRTFAAGPDQSVTATRPFGLGSDAGDGGFFGALAICGILASASLAGRRRYLLLDVCLAIGAVVAIVTSQGRGVIVSSVIIVIAYALLTATSRNRLTGVLGIALVVIVCVFVVQAIAGSAGSGGLRYSGLSPSSLLKTTNQARGSSISLIPHNLVTFPFGAGLGTAGPASTAPGPSALTIQGNVDTETGISYLIVETGIPGMVVYMSFIVALLVLGARRVRKEPDGEVRLLLAAVIAPLAALLPLSFSSDVSVIVPTGPYLWAAAGIIAYWLVALPAARQSAPRQSHETATSQRLWGSGRKSGSRARCETMSG
jgi:hypothetical protein